MVLGTRNFLVALVNLLLGAVSILLGLRIIFRLLGANSATPFVAWIYQVSENLMMPFRGMFPNLNIGGNLFLDTVAVISLIVYALLAFIAVALIDTAFRPALYDRSPRRHYSDEVHAHNLER